VPSRRTPSPASLAAPRKPSSLLSLTRLRALSAPALRLFKPVHQLALRRVCPGYHCNTSFCRPSMVNSRRDRRGLGIDEAKMGCPIPSISGGRGSAMPRQTIAVTTSSNCLRTSNGPSLGVPSRIAPITSEPTTQTGRPHSIHFVADFAPLMIDYATLAGSCRKSEYQSCDQVAPSPTNHPDSGNGRSGRRGISTNCCGVRSTTS